MQSWKIAGTACALAVFACYGPQLSAAETEDDSARDLAADTASLPQTDIFVSPLSFTEGMPQLGELRNVTAAPGYDNQPSFLPDAAAFYFVSEGAAGKTDIWRYDIELGKKTRISDSTIVSEYSPKAAPGNYGISYIQENEEADVTRVHHAPVAGGPGAPVIDLAPLGYYAWLNGDATLGVYLRSEPATLHLVDVASGDRVEVFQNIGRTLQPSPDGKALYFTRVDDVGLHEVMMYHAADRVISHRAPMMDGAQDFFVTFSAAGDAAGLFAGAASALYYLPLGEKTAQWAEVVDFTAYGMSNITRIAVSDDGNWIAIVADSD